MIRILFIFTCIILLLSCQREESLVLFNQIRVDGEWDLDSTRSTDSMIVLGAKNKDSKFMTNIVLYRTRGRGMNSIINELKYGFDKLGHEVHVVRESKIQNGYIIDYAISIPSAKLGSTTLLLKQSSYVYCITHTALNEPEGSYLKVRDIFLHSISLR